MRPNKVADRASVSKAELAQLVGAEGRTRQLMETSLEDALFFRKGQPHINVGVPILARDPFTLCFAVLQALLVVIVAHDAFRLLDQDLAHAVIAGYLPMTAMAQFAPTHGRAGLLLYIVAFIPFFFLINIGWVLFAEKLLFPERGILELRSIRHPRTLLGGLMGLVPLSLVVYIARGCLIPEWVEIRSTWLRLGTRSATPLLAQFYTAARIALLNNSETTVEAELALARALNMRGEEIWDGLGSFFLVPALAASAMLILSYLAIHFGFFPDISSAVCGTGILLSIGFVAFVKAGFGALLIDAMRQASSQTSSAESA